MEIQDALVERDPTDAKSISQDHHDDLDQEHREREPADNSTEDGVDRVEMPGKTPPS